MTKTKTKVIKNDVYDQARDAKVAFTHCFGTENAATRLVMKELARFCRADSSTFHPDPRVHALLEGRRETFLRIKDFVELPVEELVKKYGGLPNGIQ